MALLKITDWLQQQMESSPKTRLMTGIVAGQYPLAGSGSPHGHRTLPPGQEEVITKMIGKKPNKIKYKLPPA